MVRRKTTKELLGESVHELAEKKPVDKITVREIVENCGLSSATFYRHFQDKNALIAWIYNYQMEDIFMDFCEGSESWGQALFDMLEVLDRDRSFYRNALKHTEGENSFFCSTHSRSIELLTEFVRRSEKAVDDEILFDVKFYLLGVSFSIIDWFLNQRPHSAGQMADYLCRAMPESLKPVLQ